MVTLPSDLTGGAPSTLSLAVAEVRISVFALVGTNLAQLCFMLATNALCADRSLGFLLLLVPLGCSQPEAVVAPVMEQQQTTTDCDTPRAEVLLRCEFRPFITVTHTHADTKVSTPIKLKRGPGDGKRYEGVLGTSITDPLTGPRPLANKVAT